MPRQKPKQLPETAPLKFRHLLATYSLLMGLFLIANYIPQQQLCGCPEGDFAGGYGMSVDFLCDYQGFPIKRLVKPESCAHTNPLIPAINTASIIVIPLISVVVAASITRGLAILLALGRFARPASKLTLVLYVVVFIGITLFLTDQLSLLASWTTAHYFPRLYLNP